jgi:hypothetical protein
MSFNYTAYPTGPTPISPAAKTVQVKAVKLTFADFTTGGTAAVKAALPADASVTGFKVWTKTTFSGNGVTVVSLQIGVTGTAAKYLASSTLTLTGPSAIAIPTGVTSATGAFQEWDPTAPNTDQQMLFTGTATTGNPTAGEAYVLIEYVR